MAEASKDILRGAPDEWQNELLIPATDEIHELEEEKATTPEASVSYA